MGAQMSLGMAATWKWHLHWLETVQMSYWLFMSNAVFTLAWCQGCDDTHLLSSLFPPTAGPLRTVPVPFICQPHTLALPCYPLKTRSNLSGLAYTWIWMPTSLLDHTCSAFPHDSKTASSLPVYITVPNGRAHLAWQSQTDSQFKLRIRPMPLCRRLTSGAMPTDVDKTACAHNWRDVRPTRGMKHVT